MAISICIVEQLGLAMILSFAVIAPGIYLGHDQGDIFFHPPCRRVVNDNGPVFGKYRGPLFRYSRSGGEESQVRRSLNSLHNTHHFHRLAPEGHLLPCGTLRSCGKSLSTGKLLSSRTFSIILPTIPVAPNCYTFIFCYLKYLYELYLEKSDKFNSFLIPLHEKDYTVVVRCCCLYVLQLSSHTPVRMA